MTGNEQVDAYLANVGSPQRDTLEAVRRTLRSILPHADEGLKYGMPAFILDGDGVAGYAAFDKHCSYFPMSGTVIDRAGDALARYETSKGGVRFAVDKPLPITVVRRLVKLRLEELSDVGNGRRNDYFDDGRVKATGRMKDGELDGPWTWFRRDGSRLRTGQFSSGDRVGTWTSWDRDGQPVKVTHFPRRKATR